MNEQIDTLEHPENLPIQINDVRSSGPFREREASPAIAPQAGCPSCGGEDAAAVSTNGNGAVSYVYAVGRIEARFPSLAAEKEFAQATSRTDTVGKTDQQTFHAVLSRREHRYLVRQLCWVLTIQGLETYLLQPRDPADIDLLGNR